MFINKEQTPKTTTTIANTEKSRNKQNNLFLPTLNPHIEEEKENLLPLNQSRLLQLKNETKMKKKINFNRCSSDGLFIQKIKNVENQ